MCRGETLGDSLSSPTWVAWPSPLPPLPGLGRVADSGFPNTPRSALRLALSRLGTARGPKPLGPPLGPRTPLIPWGQLGGGPFARPLLVSCGSQTMQAKQCPCTWTANFSCWENRRRRPCPLSGPPLATQEVVPAPSPGPPSLSGMVKGTEEGSLGIAFGDPAQRAKGREG